MIDSYKRQKQRLVREEVDRVFVLADAISSRIAYFFSDPKKRKEDSIVQPWNVYPSLYKSTEEEAKAKREQRELEHYKNKRREAAKRWNQKFEVEHGKQQ